MSDHCNHNAAGLPIGWARATLADLFVHPNKNIVDGPFGSNLKASEYKDSGAPILRIQNIDRLAYVPKNIKYVSHEKAAVLARHSFVGGDIILTKLGDPLGKACILPNELSGGIIVADLIRLRLDNSFVDKRWLCYAINADGIAAQLRDLTKGTTRPRVNLTHVRDLVFDVPPLPEQRRVVAKLDQLLTELDDGVQSLTTARLQLKAYRQSVLNYAFEGKLTAEWRAKHPDTETGAALRQRILKTRRDEWEKAEKARLKEQGHSPSNDHWRVRYPGPEGFDAEDLPALPDEWCWAGLDEMVSGKPRSMQSGPFGSNLLHSEFQASGVLVLGIDNVRDGAFSMGSQNRISEEKFRNLEKYQARPGDLLVTVMASLGRTCIVPRDLERAIITKHVYRISMEEQLLLPEYFNLLFQSQTVSRLRMFENAQGQTRPGLNSSILKALPIPLCSRKEQVELVSRLSSHLSSIDSMVSQIDDELCRATTLRWSILKRAFSGQLVTQDSNDGPASALLERIRTQKAEIRSGRKKNENGKEEAA
jgi:type I restriction enzyme S subunit